MSSDRDTEAPDAGYEEMLRAARTVTRKTISNGVYMGGGYPTVGFAVEKGAEPRVHTRRDSEIVIDMTCFSAAQIPDPRPGPAHQHQGRNAAAFLQLPFPFSA